MRYTATDATTGTITATADGDDAIIGLTIVLTGTCDSATGADPGPLSAVDCR